MPVVVGGLLTLVGTVAAALGTAIRDVVQRRNKEKKRRADKFEELVAAVYEFEAPMSRKPCHPLPRCNRFRRSTSCNSAH